MFRLFKFLLFTGLLAVGAWFFREPLLRGAAEAWIVDEPVATADAVVVLGGGRDWRPFAAADLYLARRTPLVLIAQPEVTPSQELLNHPTDAQVSLAVLTQKGVPPAHIQPFGTNVTSTRDEALALREWALAHPATRAIVIPTDPFHTRRTRWIFQKTLTGTGVSVHVIAVPHPRYQAEDWWQHEEGVINFQNEALKSLYYLISY